MKMEHYENLKKIIRDSYNYYEDKLSKANTDRKFTVYELGDLKGRIAILSKLKVVITMFENEESE